MRSCSFLDENFCRMLVQSQLNALMTIKAIVNVQMQKGSKPTLSWWEMSNAVLQHIFHQTELEKRFLWCCRQIAIPRTRSRLGSRLKTNIMWQQDSLDLLAFKFHHLMVVVISKI